MGRDSSSAFTGTGYGTSDRHLDIVKERSAGGLSELVMMEDTQHQRVAGEVAAFREEVEAMVMVQNKLMTQKIEIPKISQAELSNVKTSEKLKVSTIDPDGELVYSNSNANSRTNQMDKIKQMTGSGNMASPEIQLLSLTNESLKEQPLEMPTTN